MTKEEIITSYLNAIYFGSGAFGNENMIIYCKAQEKPSEWMNDWNLIYGADYIDVVWGYEE